MKENSTVSVIIPCYNAEKTVARALKSVFNQTYRPIELIVVNDGSTDCTEQVIKNETVDYEQNGITFKYVYQENRGLGGAIDAGLKHFTGEYLAWFDSDDELMPESFEKRVAFLMDNPEYACVTSDAYIVNDTDWDKPVGLVSEGFTRSYEPFQFELLLNNRSIFCCGCHLIRASVFNRVNPEKSIYPSRAGQNWQLLLPVYYKNKRAFLAEPLYKYGAYTESMSAQIKKMPFEKRLKRELEYIDVIVNTLNSIKHMPAKERKHYIFEFRARVYHNVLNVCKDYNRRGVYFKYCIKLLFMGRLKTVHLKRLFRMFIKKCERF